MKKFIAVALAAFLMSLGCGAQEKAKYYDEQINPVTQVKAALKQAGKEGKYLCCQVGGNWCPWCIKFYDYIKADSGIWKIVQDNFVYIHVNYDKKNPHNDEAMKMLSNPRRFGVPCMVILSSDGKVLHLQDSGLLEEGESYNRDKVLKFFKNWTPEAVNTLK